MSEVSIRRGAYPGSFNPPTLAHLAIAEAALAQRELDRLDLIVSRVTLAKEHVDRPLLEHRIAVLRDSVADIDWLDVVVTDLMLMADIAAGYDVVVMGADKWGQVNDPVFYGDSVPARDAALARLPELAIAPRAPLACPDEHRLDLPEHLGEVSSTRTRAGQKEWMTPAAADFDRRTGAWTEPERYERWISR